MKTNFGMVLIGIALIAGVVLGYFQSQKWLKNEAIQGCLLVGIDKFVSADGKGGAEIPNQKAYEVCMKEKGY